MLFVEILAELITRPTALISFAIYLAGLTICYRRRKETPSLSKIAGLSFSLCTLSSLMGAWYRVWMFHVQMASFGPVDGKPNYFAPKASAMDQVKLVGKYIVYADVFLWVMIWGLIIYALFYLKPSSTGTHANA